MTGEEEMSAAVVIAIIIGIVIFIIVILALLFFLCRDRVQCLAKKEVLPEGDTPWKYVNRYGETNLKFVNYKLRDIRDRRHRKRGDHQPIVMNKTEKYYDPNESQSIRSEEVVANNNSMFVYETIDSMPQEHAPRSHVIEDEYTQVPRKKGKRGKKKRKRQSPEREPKALPALQDRGFRSKAPPIDGGSHRQRNVDDDSYYVRQSTPRDHMQIDSDGEYR